MSSSFYSKSKMGSLRNSPRKTGFSNRSGGSKKGSFNASRHDGTNEKKHSIDPQFYRLESKSPPSVDSTLLDLDVEDRKNLSPVLQQKI